MLVHVIGMRKCVNENVTNDNGFFVTNIRCPQTLMTGNFNIEV